MSAIKKRRTISLETVDELMFRNRHTCCICRDESKHVQIHHINGDPSNNDINNLAVVCLGCHSRVSGDQGLGRRFTSGEIRRYKREWESLNLSKLGSGRVIDDIEAAVLRADISRLMVEVISLNDIQRRLEALDQIESYYIYRDMQEEALEAIGTVLLGSVWGDAQVTAACAERIHHLFWGLPGPEHVAFRPEHEALLKKAISNLEWTGKHATEYMRSASVMRGLSASILNLYQIAVAYSRDELAVSLLSVVKETFEACTMETEFAGDWAEGIDSVLELLSSLQEVTPNTWVRVQDRISALMKSDVAQSYLRK